MTGFSLLGHGSHIARASGVTLLIDIAAVPLLPGTLASIAAGTLTGGAARNASYLEPLVDYGSCTESERALLVDPQTSGGLLVAVPQGKVDDYLARVDGAVVVGTVRVAGRYPIVVR